MTAAQHALSLLARWPLAAAGRPAAVREAACLLCQPLAPAPHDLLSSVRSSLPALNAPQHSTGGALDLAGAGRGACSGLPEPCAAVWFEERHSTAAAMARLPELLPRPATARQHLRTAQQLQTRQQV